MTNEELAKYRIELRKIYRGNTIRGNCSDPWTSKVDEVDGKCPDCDCPTVKGEAATGCSYSPIDCKTCGSRPCDGSC